MYQMVSILNEKPDPKRRKPLAKNYYWNTHNNNNNNNNQNQNRNHDNNQNSGSHLVSETVSMYNHNRFAEFRNEPEKENLVPSPPQQPPKESFLSFSENNNSDCEDNVRERSNHHHHHHNNNNDNNNNNNNDNNNSDLMSGFETPRFLVLEHGCFFLGAVLATMEGILHLHVAKKVDDKVHHRDDFYTQTLLGPWGLFQLLNIGSTSFYLLDSTVHFWMTDPQHEAIQHRLACLLFGVASLSDLLASALDVHHDHGVVFLDDLDAVLGFLAAYLFLGSAILNLFRRRNCCLHWQHHQNKTHILAQTYNQSQSLIIRRGRHSIQHFFIKAGSRDLPRWWHFWTTDDGRLLAILLGDCLFFIATVIDVVVVHLDNVATNQTSEEWIVVSQWSLFAALLWLADSVLYLAADLLPRERGRRGALGSSHPEQEALQRSSSSLRRNGDASDDFEFDSEEDESASVSLSPLF